MRFWPWICSHHHAGRHHAEALCELCRLTAAVCQQTRLAWQQCLPMQTTLEPPTLLCRRTWPDLSTTTCSWDCQMFRVTIEQLRQQLFPIQNRLYLRRLYRNSDAVVLPVSRLSDVCMQWAYWCCIKTAVCCDDCIMYQAMLKVSCVVHALSAGQGMDSMRSSLSIGACLHQWWCLQ